MNTITVYTKPACVQCNAVFRTLDRMGLDYRRVDITTDPEAREHVLALGYLFSLVFANCLNGRAEPWALQVPAVRRAVRSPPAPGDEPAR
jgi:glutaredoxin